jgi:hypothetical protein
MEFSRDDLYPPGTPDRQIALYRAIPVEHLTSEFRGKNDEKKECVTLMFFVIVLP